MENKIKIKIEEENILRLSIPTDGGTIVINNPSEKFKKELITLLVDCIVKNEDFDEKKIMLDLINHCTNVEFEGDIFEVEYLSHEAKMVTNEIFIIMQEITEEVYQVVRLVMQQAKNEIVQNEIMKEKDEIVDKIEKKEEVKKVVRKPQRGRRR